jgi:hypothetical protein
MLRPWRERIASMSLFSRKSPEEKAAKKQAKEERRAASQAKFEELMAARRQKWAEERGQQWETFRTCFSRTSGC